MDAQQQEQAAFDQVFATEQAPNAPTGTSTDVTAGDEVQAEPAAGPETAEADQPGTEAAPQATPEAQAASEEKPKDEDEDPVLLDGLKRSELRRLLSNAADVESLKRQLDKAHGNIGELNRKFQQAAQPAPAATPAPAQAPELSPELKRFEEEFPEVAQYVKALGITKQPAQEQPAQQAQQQDQAPQGADPAALELMVMDRMHKGWREKVVTPDFTFWMASQGTQAAFDSAQTADELVNVLGQYDQWSAARTAAADKAAKGQQRLQKATTPSGNAPRPQSALTEEQAFEAALKS